MRFDRLNLSLIHEFMNSYLYRFLVWSNFKNYTFGDFFRKNVYERKMIKRGPFGNSAEKRSPPRRQAYGPSWTRSLGRVERTLLLLSPSRSKSSIPPHHHYPQLPLPSPLKFFWIVTNLSFPDVASFDWPTHLRSPRFRAPYSSTHGSRLDQIPSCSRSIKLFLVKIISNL